MTRNYFNFPLEKKSKYQGHAVVSIYWKCQQTRSNIFNRMLEQKTLLLSEINFSQYLRRGCNGICNGIFSITSEGTTKFSEFSEQYVFLYTCIWICQSTRVQVQYYNLILLKNLHVPKDPELNLGVSSIIKYKMEDE